MDLQLVPHPATPPRAVRFVSLQVNRVQEALELFYIVETDPALLHLPAPQAPGRAEGLWETTCFELFLGDRDGAYREFNFSPSGQWAADRFREYRDDKAPLAMAQAPKVQLLPPEPFGVMLRALIVVDLEPDTLVGPAVVIEEADGTKSYWALVHPDPEEPNFHHLDSFALTLPKA